MASRVPEPIEMLRRLVAEPTVSSNDAAIDQSNRGVIDLLADWAAALGFEIERVPVGGAGDKENLIAVLDPRARVARSVAEGEGGLVFGGHTDTVPFDADRWTHDPFALTEVDGRLHGLGATDMKVFFALVLTAVSRVPRAALERPVVLVATADEETTMAGARALVEIGRPRGSWAIIGEPTGLSPVHMHKGILMDRIRLTGRSGHSSNPGLGASALEGMHGVMAALLELRRELQRDHRHDGFAMPVPTMNLGRIAGGDAANRICARCELDIDMRLLPGMALAELRDVYQQRVASAVEGTGLGLEHQPLFGGIDPFETDRQARLVQVAEELSGAQAIAVAFGTEAPFFQSLGHETIVLGAGSIDVAHAPDEYVPAAAIEPAMTLYEGMIRRLCMAEA